jgi:hypothetical protein
VDSGQSAVSASNRAPHGIDNYDFTHAFILRHIMSALHHGDRGWHEAGPATG